MLKQGLVQMFLTMISIQGSERVEATLGSNHPDNDNTEDIRPAQTVVIQENNDATSEESIHDSGRDEPTFGSNLPDNENTEDVGPAKTVMIQENNDATSQERTIQGRQRVKARLGSNPPSQDGELSVLAQEKNETTSDKNVQDSGHAPARSDFSSRADYALSPLSSLVFLQNKLNFTGPDKRRVMNRRVILESYDFGELCVNHA